MRFERETVKLAGYKGFRCQEVGLDEKPDDCPNYHEAGKPT